MHCLADLKMSTLISVHVAILNNFDSVNLLNLLKYFLVLTLLGLFLDRSKL